MRDIRPFRGSLPRAAGGLTGMDKLRRDEPEGSGHTLTLIKPRIIREGRLIFI